MMTSRGLVTTLTRLRHELTTTSPRDCCTTNSPAHTAHSTSTRCSMPGAFREATRRTLIVEGDHSSPTPWPGFTRGSSSLRPGPGPTQGSDLASSISSQGAFTQTIFILSSSDNPKNYQINPYFTYICVSNVCTKGNVNVIHIVNIDLMLFYSVVSYN